MDENIMLKNKRIVIAGYAVAYLLFILVLPRSAGVFRGFSQLVTYIVLGVWGIYLFRNDFLEGFSLWKSRVQYNFVWLAATLVGGIIAQQLAALPAYMLGSEDLGGNTEVLFEISRAFPLPFIIISLGVLGPVTEEIIYRVILIGRASQKVWGIACVALSSIVFMLLHVQAFTVIGLADALPIFAIALSYAIVYYKTKNITIPVILHMLNNSIGLIGSALW